MSEQLLHRFAPGFAEGDGSMKALLGGKGSALADMCKAGLPVPPGFTIETTVCHTVIAAGGKLPDSLKKEVESGIAFLEHRTGSRLGDPSNPLLVSVRSGAAVSMPGMMDTILDLGMNDEVAVGLARRTERPAFAWDCFRRFIDLFSTVVMGLPHHAFDEPLEELKKERGVKSDRELNEADLKRLVNEYRATYRAHTGEEFPTDPRVQLERAIGAVFLSWNTERAIKYREVQHLTGLAGTAVTVQAMVFGNLGQTSGTGVLFTRNTATGDKELYGEYLVDAQGEDVVAGIRTPNPISHLEKDMPDVHRQLEETVQRLEKYAGDVQDVEFTIQEGKLFMLQTRSGKRTGAAAVKIAGALVDEGIATKEDALTKLVGPEHIDHMLHPHFADEAAYRKANLVIAKGLPASPGAAVGRIVFTANEAEEWKKRGEKVILVRTETSAEDVGGMHAAMGILTTRGGMTSHAAVVARGWGKPCVAGCGELTASEKTKTLTKSGVEFHEGDWLSLNGATGEVIRGKLELKDAEITPEMARVLSWADEVRRLGVHANADTPNDARVARSFGAAGIGLCRTEHMFFAPDRIPHVRRMILADDEQERQRALDALLPFQRDDFTGILSAMAGYPVTIRLLDPPLHEFLPNEPKQQEELAKLIGVPVEKVRARVNELHEMNPMLGHRGCRLGITQPAITQMQARAIFEAACALKKQGVDVHPEVMVPLVGTAAELSNQKRLVEAVAKEVIAETGVEVPIVIGTMIEVPRAALTAGLIAKEAEFFSFGTNDLTQMTFGYSRDDAGRFLPDYVKREILPTDPFQSIDPDGVGALVKMAVEAGRAANPRLHIGICGEHGGDPASIAFFHGAGLDYVSCSPFRVPIARLAAARAAIAEKKG